jgi:hypothetical protein
MRSCIWRRCRLPIAVLLLGIACLYTPASAQGNTLVTGVITDQNGQVTNDLLEVRVYAGKKRLAETKAHDGLFVIDIAGLAAPNAEVTVQLRPQAFDKGDADKARTYSAATTTVALANAQNLHLKVQFDYAKDHPEVGPYPDMPKQ